MKVLSWKYLFAGFIWLVIYSPANAITIGFDTLVPPSGAYPGHHENGYTVEPLAGNWVQITGLNNYVRTASTDHQSVEVTNGLFTMTSIELAHLGGTLATDSIFYFVEGYKDDIPVFAFNGSLRSSSSIFETITNPYSGLVIDQLVIGRLDGVSRMALDNIVVSSIQIPETPLFALMGIGLAGISYCRKKLRAD